MVQCPIVQSHRYRRTRTPGEHMADPSRIDDGELTLGHQRPEELGSEHSNPPPCPMAGAFFCQTLAEAANLTRGAALGQTRVPIAREPQPGARCVSCYPN